MGWFGTFLKNLVADDPNVHAKESQRARGRIDGRQIVAPGSYVRLTKGEWRGEDGVVTSTRLNGEVLVRLQRNGREVHTWEHHVEAIRAMTKDLRPTLQRGLHCRINHGQWRGRVATISDFNTGGTVWLRLRDTMNGQDPDAGKEVRVGANEITVLGR